MGGSTITLVADNLEDLFLAIEKQIIAASKMGLYVDSELVVIDPWIKVARFFRVEYAPLGTKMSFIEIPKGRVFHVGVAGRFGPKPEPGQIVGTVHVHS